MVPVELTWREIQLAGAVTVSRITRHVAQGDQPKWGQPPDRFNSDDDWQGAIGECATAKYLGTYWAGVSPRTIDATIADVRAVSVRGHRLILHPEDKDDLPMVLAIVERRVLPVVHLAGWIMGRDGKVPEFWTDPGTGRPAFFIPVNRLRPMDELKASRAELLDRLCA